MGPWGALGLHFGASGGRKGPKGRKESQKSIGVKPFRRTKGRFWLFPPPPGSPEGTRFGPKDAKKEVGKVCFLKTLK